MTTTLRYQLRLTVEGATEAELKRGAEAALACFEEAGITPMRAADGMFALEGWDDAGFPDDGLSEDDSAAADIWMEADRRAVEACCADWPAERERPSWCLEVVRA